MPSPAVVRVLARPQDARREDPDGGLSGRRPLVPHTVPPEGRAAAHDRLVQREPALGPPFLARTSAALAAPTPLFRPSHHPRGMLPLPFHDRLAAPSSHRHPGHGAVHGFHCRFLDVGRCHHCGSAPKACHRRLALPFLLAASAWTCAQANPKTAPAIRSKNQFARSAPMRTLRSMILPSCCC